MANKIQEDGPLHYIARVQKQHSSCIVVIPKAVRTALGIGRGDIVLFELYIGRRKVDFSKFIIPGGQVNGNVDTENPAG